MQTMWDGLPFRVVEWDERTGGILKEHARLADPTAANAAYDVIVGKHPKARITLQHGILIMSRTWEDPPEGRRR